MFDYRARLLEITDGDTVVLLLDVGFRARVEESIRLISTWAPEKRTPGGLETSKVVADWYSKLNQSKKWPLYVMTLPNKLPEPDEKESFTRFLGYVWEFDNRANSLNNYVTAYLAGHPEWGKGTT